MLAALALVISQAACAEVALALDPQLTTWLELDSNAKRVPSGTLDDDGSLDPNRPRERVVGDGLVRAATSVSSEARGPRFVLRNDSAAGLKLFLSQDTERMGVAQSRTSLVSRELPLGFVAMLSSIAKGRAQLSGARTYALLRGDALLEHALPAKLALRSGLSGQAFHAFDNALFSSTQGSLVFGLRAQPTDTERVDLSIDLGLRTFPFATRAPNDALEDENRRDVLTSGAVNFSSARRIFLAAGYAVVRNTSNARAESFTRHRLSGVIGFRLPEEITCSAQGALQLTSYDDGVSLGQRYFLGDDEESQNVIEVQLSRPIIGGVFLEARASVMGNELAVEGARFSRQTAAIGLRAEL
jgi:hypothetical protein